MTGHPADPPKVGDGVFECVNCRATLDGPYLRSEGLRGGLGMRIAAVVGDIAGRRRYRAPTAADTVAANVSIQDDVADVAINVAGQGIRVGLYGMDQWSKLYVPRQLLTLTTFSDLVASTHGRVIAEGGTKEWADAVTTLLGLAVGQLARSGSTQCLWRTRLTAHSKAESAYARNDLPMMWDFAEPYFAGGSVGDWLGVVQSVSRGVAYAPVGEAKIELADARSVRQSNCLVATDPPYFDAIGYADLSDYFYLWHRRALRNVHPDLYRTVAAPKTGELTAIPSHHQGSKEAARQYFIAGFTETFENLQLSMAEDVPMIVIYASKEQKSGKGEETRWNRSSRRWLTRALKLQGPAHPYDKREEDDRRQQEYGRRIYRNSL